MPAGGLVVTSASSWELVSILLRDINHNSSSKYLRDSLLRHLEVDLTLLAGLFTKEVGRRPVDPRRDSDGIEVSL